MKFKVEKKGDLNELLSRFHIMPIGNSVEPYILEKYGKLIRAYKRGKHHKNVVRKILRDPSLQIKKRVGIWNKGWSEISLK